VEADGLPAELVSDDSHTFGAAEGTQPELAAQRLQLRLRLISMVMVLGIDIGGTGSRARLCADGEIVAESEAASASIPATGQVRAEAALDELLAGLPLSGATRLDAICVGTAGLSVPGAAEFLHAKLSPLCAAVEIVSDAMLVLPAAGLDAGVAVICGTGSVAVGTYRGRMAQAGGWGYLLGDEGGGYWVVREAFRVLLSRRDRDQPQGDLGARLLTATGAGDLAELQRFYYQEPHLPRQWARHASQVTDSTDPAAEDIVARAAAAAAVLAVTTIDRLAGPSTLPVVLAGGLSGSPIFADAARSAVTSALPATEFHVLDGQPVAGAVRLARRAASREGADA
jgi:N-acetylglucosamine kinase-like BadF-type ATPase